MALRNYLYNISPSNFGPETWVSKNVCAQLVTSYSFSAAHTTRADINVEVGSPVALTNKTRTYDGTITTLDCDDITFTGTPSAKFIVFYEWNGSSAQSSDKVLAAVDLNAGQSADVLIDAPIVVSNLGVFTFSFANS